MYHQKETIKSNQLPVMKQRNCYTMNKLPELPLVKPDKRKYIVKHFQSFYNYLLIVTLSGHTH